MVRKLFYAAISSFLLLAGYFFTFVYREDLQIFPSRQLKTRFYNDISDHGNSQILKRESDKNKLHFEYRLDDGFMYPYCGVAISTKENKYWDFSDHNSLKIIFKPHQLNSFFLYFHVFDPTVKNAEKRHAARRLLKSMKVKDQDWQSVEINFRDFETPTWWFNLIKQDRSEFGTPDLAKVESIHFTSGLDQELNVQRGFEIKEIVISYNYYNDLVLLGLLWFLSVLASVVYLRVKKKKVDKEFVKPSSVPRVEVEYKPVEVESRKKQDFIEYINSQFQDPGLTLTSVSEKFGISERSISTHISEKFGCNFKTYVNSIRINEAKRLLEQEELTSGEVAYLVGFNSPANFNRVFKNMVGSSPTEYIQNLQSI